MKIHKVIQSLNYVKEDNPFLIPLIEMLEKSAKFDLGRYTKDDEDLYNGALDMGKEIILHNLYKPPYPISYFELVVEGDHETLFTGVLTLSNEFLTGMAGPKMQSGFIDLGKSEAPLTRNFLFLNTPKDAGRTPYSAASHIVDLEEQGATSMRALPGALEDEHAANRIAQSVRSIVAVSAGLLTTKGVTTPLIIPDIKLNKARARRNKPPLYEHHIVKLGGVSSSGRLLGVGAKHASPRQHWRRGHIRVIHRDTPKEKKIIIPCCLIAGRGFISKEYHV